MTAVDRWVIREVLAWCSDHPRAMSEIQGVCINLSGPTLNDETFAPYLAAELAARRVPGDRICFEVTETAAVLADYAMVRSINELGHFLGKRTVAEFVESEDILARLTEIGLDYGQGYAIARPIPMHELAGQL